jgi:hypothetical protein
MTCSAAGKPEISVHEVVEFGDDQGGEGKDFPVNDVQGVAVLTLRGIERGVEGGCVGNDDQRRAARSLMCW